MLRKGEESKCYEKIGDGYAEKGNEQICEGKAER